MHVITVGYTAQSERPGRLPKPAQVRNTLLGLACAGVLAGILVAGLWPFHAPANQVYWLPGGGLWFGSHGTVLSAGAFNAQGTHGNGPCSVEVVLAPATVWDKRTILSVYSANHTVPFFLGQSDRALVIEGESRDVKAQGARRELEIPGVFRPHRIAFISVTSDGVNTAVYLNGEPVFESRTLGFSRKDLTGELIIANSPKMDRSWSGMVKALAIDNGFLTPETALRQNASWVENPRAALGGAGQPAALYLFDQAAGPMVRSKTGQGPDLYIPKRFTVLDQFFLERPWHEYAYHRSYWKNTVINVAGFIPLGFFFCAWLSLVLRHRRAVLITILSGAAVSTTIEVLQAYLPTRFSGMTDLFTNTFGTAIGAALYLEAARACEALSRSRNRAIREVAIWLTS